MSPNLAKEISSLKSQIEIQGKLFDQALKEDSELDRAKKLYHEIRLLRARLDELVR